MNQLPALLRKQYVFNPSKFDEFYNSLRAHQKNAIESIKGKDIGQITIPTGTGKTYIQKCIHVQDMIDKMNVGECGIYVIAAHRLLLCNQLLDELIKLIFEVGINVDILYVGTEKLDFNAFKAKYKSTGIINTDIEIIRTTNCSLIKEKVNRAHSLNRHMIIVSTYHSFDRLRDIDKLIDIVTYDEAHTTTSEDFTQNINKINKNIRKQYFFTATRKVIGETGGQNNEVFYGQQLYDMSPREAVDNNEIVQPRIHFIKSSKQVDISSLNNIGMMVKTVTEGFIEHEKQLNVTLGSKVLVTVNGLDELHSIRQDPIFEDFCKQNNINTFVFSSDKGFFHNFEQKARNKVFDEMNKLNNTDKAIFFHYDILTEGIDLPAITGVLILRDLGKIKLLQNIGRAARLLKEDRVRIYSGELNPSKSISDKQKMIKPYCWVIIPEYLKTLSGVNSVRDMIMCIRETYNIPFEHMGEFDDKALTRSPNILPSVIPPIPSSSKSCKLYHDFESITYNIGIQILENDIFSTNKGREYERIIELLNMLP